MKRTIVNINSRMLPSRFQTDHTPDLTISRLKQVVNIGSDYFDEMLERIRDIRSSEKRFYQKIRDIYKLAVDYDPKAEETLAFFKIVQNKLHFAISGKTAAELIADRADASQPNMGLTAWKGEKVRKGDVAELSGEKTMNLTTEDQYVLIFQTLCRQ